MSLFSSDSRVAFNYMQHWFNRVINFRVDEKKVFKMYTRDIFWGDWVEKKRKEAFSFRISKCFVTKMKFWESKEFIYISFHSPRSPHPTYVTMEKAFEWEEKGLKNTHVIRFNWIFMPNILRFSSDIHPNHPRVWNTCHREKTKKSFFFCYFSILLDRKFVKWFMRSSSTDNKSFV